MKELKVDDFPLEATDKVKRSFKRNIKMERVSKIMMEAIFFELASMKDLDPWETARKEMPELIGFIKHTRLTYNQISGHFVIAPE